jgi:hypothetical protein
MYAGARSRNLTPELRKPIQRRLRHFVPFDLFPRPKFRRGARLPGPAYHAVNIPGELRKSASSDHADWGECSECAGDFGSTLACRIFILDVVTDDSANDSARDDDSA